MVLVTINPAKRLLYLAYVGRVDVTQMERAKKDIEDALELLPANIRVLGDLERLDSMDSASSTVLGQAMDLLDCKGVELSVRVIPDPSKDIGLAILSRFHYRKEVRVVTCGTMEEAARELGL